MIGDLRWFYKKFHEKYREKHPYKKRFMPYIFKYEEINTLSDLKTCELIVTDDRFIIDDETVVLFKDIFNIERIDTILRVSNKGRVVKITLKDDTIFCFSFGRPTAFSKLGSTTLIYSDFLFCLFCEKWELSKRGKKGTLY